MANGEVANGKIIFSQTTLVPVSVIVTIIGVAVSIGMVMQRVNALESANLPERTTRVETQFTAIQETLGSIDKRLERIENKR